MDHKERAYYTAKREATIIELAALEDMLDVPNERSALAKRRLEVGRKETAQARTQERG